MDNQRKFALTLFDSLTDVEVKEDNRRYTTWENIVKCLSYPRIKNSKERIPMFTGADFHSGTTRNGDNIEAYHLLVLDYDGEVHPNYFVQCYSTYEFMLYSSYNHNWNKETHEVDTNIWKFRVVIPLEKPVSPNDYREAKPVLMDMFPDADPAGFSVSQAFFLPGCHFDRQNQFMFHHNVGKALDFDGMKTEILLKKAGQLIEHLNRQSWDYDFDNSSSLKDAEGWLNKMDPDCDYDTWWKIGACLKGLFGDEAFDVWDGWSSNGSGYNPRVMQNKWRGFRDTQTYSFGYIVNRAREWPLK